MCKNVFLVSGETAQKMKFSIKDFFSKCDQIQFPADLVTFTEQILNGKFHFLCRESSTLWNIYVLGFIIEYQSLTGFENTPQ